jgi:hypothetical protein
MGMLPYAARGAASIAVAAAGERLDKLHLLLVREVALLNWAKDRPTAAFEWGEVSMYVLCKSDPSSWELCM